MYLSYSLNLNIKKIEGVDFNHMKINSKQRKYLKSLSHHIKPKINIGKDGLTKGVITSINEYINKKELIKVRFVQYKNDKKNISTSICSKIKCEQVGLIGNNLIIYKKSLEEKYCQITLP